MIWKKLLVGDSRISYLPSRPPSVARGSVDTTGVGQHVRSCTDRAPRLTSRGLRQGRTPPPQNGDSQHNGLELQ
jgi:hypothetical protein